GPAAFSVHSCGVLRGCMLHMRPRSMRTHVDGQHRGEMRESTARAGMHGCSRPDRSTKLPTNERLPTKKLQLPADLVFAPTLACWSSCRTVSPRSHAIPLLSTRHWLNARGESAARAVRSHCGLTARSVAHALSAPDSLSTTPASPTMVRLPT